MRAKVEEGDPLPEPHGLEQGDCHEEDDEKMPSLQRRHWQIDRDEIIHWCDRE